MTPSIKLWPRIVSTSYLHFSIITLYSTLQLLNGKRVEVAVRHGDVERIRLNCVTGQSVFPNIPSPPVRATNESVGMADGKKMGRAGCREVRREPQKLSAKTDGLMSVA